MAQLPSQAGWGQRIKQQIGSSTFWNRTGPPHLRAKQCHKLMSDSHDQLYSIHEAMLMIIFELVQQVEVYVVGGGDWVVRNG